MRERETPLRGVNLGGWLVLERWMTPSLFAGTDAPDEWSFMMTPSAIEKLQKHRDAFITEADFAWLAEHGFTAVRLPVGYWVLAGDAPYQKGIRYVDWAFRMAEKYKLQVLLDLHAALGSQNGRDHSGRKGKAEWFCDAAAQAATVRTIAELYQRYHTSPSYWGIELLNEPRFGVLHWKLRRYYRQAAAEVKTGHVVFHDAFTPCLMSGALHGNTRAVMDVHLYHMTSWLARIMSARQFVRKSSLLYGRTLHRAARKQPVIVGEWSIVLRGETLRSIPADEQLALMRDYGRQQLAVYEQYAAGWFYWNYKTEQPGIWNARSLVASGIFPPLGD